MDNNLMRLQKYIALCGIASRRSAEVLISEGRVSVNGNVVTELGVKVSGKEKICIDGAPIRPEKKKYYIMMNKPEGIISAAKPERDRKCVIELIEGIDARLFPVGRLDADTSGLILITNDGEFAHKLTHPSFEIWKTYEALVKRTPSETAKEKFGKGIELEDGITLPAVMEVTGYKGNNAICEVSIREGRNRQIRRMFDVLGHPVIKLKRIALAGLYLEDLKPGKWRKLTGKELEMLMDSKD